MRPTTCDSDHLEPTPAQFWARFFEIFLFRFWAAVSLANPPNLLRGTTPFPGDVRPRMGLVSKLCNAFRAQALPPPCSTALVASWDVGLLSEQQAPRSGNMCKAPCKKDVDSCQKDATQNGSWDCVCCQSNNRLSKTTPGKTIATTQSAHN